MIRIEHPLGIQQQKQQHNEISCEPFEIVFVVFTRCQNKRERENRNSGIERERKTTTEGVKIQFSDLKYERMLASVFSSPIDVANPILFCNQTSNQSF